MADLDPDFHQEQLGPAQPTFIASTSRTNLRKLDLCHRVALNGSQLRAASFIAKGPTIWQGLSKSST
ncbi:hypothetical protein [uncultured Roseovarius sp.]|uniref:hypothetical protein n=1 Tax=uncultured Roseovarius sp. TaxID=293344 RepID=UPI002620EB4C|nr:hypothetical protein [uncultured Roseovarius sp.]